MKVAPPSFRTRILLTVLVVSVIPLALVGLWLTRTAQRSGVELLNGRLEETLDQAISRIGNNWLKYRSDLLFLAEDEGVQSTLSESTPGVLSQETQTRLAFLFGDLGPAVGAVSMVDRAGRVIWSSSRLTDEFDPSIRQSLTIYQRFPSRELGQLEVELLLPGLLSNASLPPPLAGMVLAAESSTGLQLLPLPFDPALLGGSRFSWGGDDWLAVRRRMSDPAVTLVAAAPLSPFSGPFEAAASRGTLWLTVVAMGGLLATYYLTRRMTRSLEELASSAEAVSRGDLDFHIDDPGPDEVGRVAQAFNSMTASLRRTLRELSSQERLAAVGEFAASLAHEVRNPLTAIRIDLQRVEESLPPDSPLREAQARALREIGRLDATVSETLDVARTGRWQVGGVDLTIPIRAAADAARPAFAERDAGIDLGSLGTEGPRIRGDERALEQLFLNLMLNAASALDPGGRAWVELDEEGDSVIASLHDTGSGIDPDVIDRIFDPLYTTRADGTGLGLTVVRRIVDDHDGQIDIESDVGTGTTVRVRLPR